MSTQELDLSLARNSFRAFNSAALAGAPVIDTKATVVLNKPKNGDVKFYGGAKQLWDMVLQGEPSVIIHGPAETGKSLAALYLLDHLCWEYDNLQCSLIRKIAADMPSTIIRTYEEKVLKMVGGKTTEGVTKYGGERPEFYTYPTGSRVWVGGMDHPGKVLSGERDLVVVNQCEELDQGDFETISTRTTGRAGGLLPGRLIGDCNPGPSTHWIMALNAVGSLKMIKSYHKDNPTLFDPQTGEITAQGKRSMTNLEKLTGVRYKRLFKGLWVAAEGVVYETWDPTIHANIEAPFAPIVYHIASIDWGLTNPGVIQVWGVDGDGRMYRVHEVYQTGKLVAASRPEDAWWVNKAKELQAKYNIQMFVPDPSRNDHILVFEGAGLPCTPAFNTVDLGIQNVESRLVVQKDGWPRLVFLKGSKPEIDPTLLERHDPTCTEEEVEVYAYPKDPKTSQAKSKKENPVEKDNHGCDAMRYAASYIDALGQNEFVFGRSE